MESSEVAVNTEELELRASELAKATKERGMGMLDGKFPAGLFKKLDRPPDTGQSLIGYFVQGEKLPNHDVILFRPRDQEFLNSEVRNGIYPSHKQFWIVNKYIPPMKNEPVIERKTIKMKTWRGLRSKTITRDETVFKPTNIPLDYHGKRGESDWIQYDYYMPAALVFDQRPNVYVDMAIVVPPDLATQIDKQVAKNVYFPDAFFEALCSEFIGPDALQHIRRRPSTELEVVDNRLLLPTRLLRPYPEPIPY